MTYSHAKVQGQWSAGSKDRVETDGQTEAIALPAALMQSVRYLPVVVAFQVMLRGFFFPFANSFFSNFNRQYINVQ